MAKTKIALLYERLSRDDELQGESFSIQNQQAMFQAANPGDTIITLEVPRLCRSTKQLCE